eukprot:evm.model.NODE_8710_length_21214_cov_36.574619.5
MSKDWNGLAKSGGLEKLKVGELKGFLKDHGISQTGEKGTLMFRIKAFLDGERLKIDGRNPAFLKAGELKKECAKRGLSPMGYPDELLESLIGYLKTNGSGNGTTAACGERPSDQKKTGAEDRVGPGMADATRAFQSVVTAFERLSEPELEEEEGKKGARAGKKKEKGKTLLRSVCAAQGYVPKSTTQSGLVREMERVVAKAEGHEETLLLEDWK